MSSNELLKSNGAQFWDANPCGGTWSGYGEFMSWIRRTEPYFYEILDRYDWEGKLVVEVGCGQGSTLNYLPQRGAQVCGMDMSGMRSLLARIDRASTDAWGFYQVIEARK